MVQFASDEVAEQAMKKDKEYICEECQLFYQCFLFMYFLSWCFYMSVVDGKPVFRFSFCCGHTNVENHNEFFKTVYFKEYFMALSQLFIHLPLFIVGSWDMVLSK